MTTDSPPTAPAHPLLRKLQRKNVLSGLMFVAIAAIGLWVSRSYPIGTALRMSSGYVPRLLCWLLMGLGVIVLVQGLMETHPPEPARERTPEDGVIAQLRPVVVVTLALITFGLALETLGLVCSILLLVMVASMANRELKLWETLAAAAGLSVLTWLIFILGLGLTIPVWPDF
ncbi:MAG TPA: tripartite tricarboxylate transporter TctB family protein [Xanthobacteraceae bacterium]|nr:tripartite tricarboxylate transporter TctB family protein [Xanthobacteraceae bacterium]